MGKYRSDFLCPKSTIVSGIATIWNITGNFYEYNRSRTPMEADSLAIREDWGVVGQDLESAFIPALTEWGKG